VFSGNYVTGLDITTLGSVSMGSISASSNTTGYGASINGSTEGKGLTITGTNTFNDNATYGLFVNINGAITANNLTANDNGTGVDLYNQGATNPYTVTLTGTNAFQDNTSVGIEIWTKGAVTVSNVSANGNGSGMLIDNDLVGTPSITMTGVNSFSYNNVSNGLQLRSFGTINLSKVTADDNASEGILVVGSANNFTLSCASLTHNGNDGLDITTTGVVTLKGVMASGNTALDINSSVVPVVVRTC
jgi:hypothetical protein